jgi:hypothetical protein
MNLEPHRADIAAEISRALAAARSAPAPDARRTEEHVCAN